MTVTTPPLYEQSAQTREPIADTTLEYVGRWLQYRTWHARIPGVQAAVAEQGRVVLSEAFGLADVERGTPLTPRHLFQIASHSKTFTAVAVLQLVERGAVRLDDPVGRYVPELAGGRSPVGDVTVFELLSHGAGIIRDGYDSDYWQTRRPFPADDEVVALAVASGEVYGRQERMKYSNIGFGLLGQVVAAASGVPYDDYVREYVVGRLGLRDTGPELEPERESEAAIGYSAFSAFDRRMPLPHVPANGMAAATGFYSTAADLCRYFAAYLPGDERLLSDLSKRRQRRPVWYETRPGTGYGLGLTIEQVHGRPHLGHGGGYPGFITATTLDLERGRSFSVLTNAMDGPASVLLRGVLDLVEVAQTPPRDPRGRVTPELRGAAEAVVGRYVSIQSMMDVALLGERLVGIDPRQPDPLGDLYDLEVLDAEHVRVVAGSATGWIGETMVFERAEDGRVGSVRAVGGKTMLPIDRYREQFARSVVEWDGV